MEEKKLNYIAIPNKLLEDIKLNVKDKYLYLILKTFCFDNTETTNISKKKLIEKLKWSDNRTLLKHLLKLKINGYIEYDFCELPRKKLLQIKLNTSDPFTMIDDELFDILLEYKNREHCLIFIYLVERYYNKEYGYAFPSIMLIQSVLKLPNSKLHNLIITLHDDKICEYCKGIYIDNKDGECRQSNNKYLPNIKCIIDGEIKRRYSHHKKKGYFNIIYDNS